MKTKLLLVLSLWFSLNQTHCQNVIVNDNVGAGNVYWTANNVYILNGGVFVNSGCALHIEPGTVIKGKSGTGENSSYLCVAKGAIIVAEGTPENPIIFTFEADPLDGSVPLTTRGQWGGLIVLGEARLNSIPGTSSIEGIPTTEIRGIYGGNNDNDSSGILKYISIRHGGTEIGAGNEINGLTLAGVGSQTIVENIEVISNNDDGIELFGGTVSVKNAIVYGAGDDSFDYDEGWRGQDNTNWIAIASQDAGDRGGEHDGGIDPETAQPYATPFIDSAIFIGNGTKRALTFRDNAGGHYRNSIFYNYEKGVDIEDLPMGQDSYERFLNNDLTFVNNIVDCASNIFVTTNNSQNLASYFLLNNNSNSNNHGLYWNNGVANLSNRANWAYWCYAVQSGKIILENNSLQIKKHDTNVLVFPNPTQSTDIICYFNEYHVGYYTLSNNVGQVVSSNYFSGKELKIDNIKTLGIYYLKLNINNNIVNKIIIKQ